MAQPDDILNGQMPDAAKLMAWFNWLAEGVGVPSGTYASKPQPEDCRFYWATDIKQLLFYTNDITVGDEGWIIIGGG